MFRARITKNTRVTNTSIYCSNTMIPCEETITHAIDDVNEKCCPPAKKVHDFRHDDYWNATHN